MNYTTCPVYDCCGGTVTHDGPPVVTPARDAEAIGRAAYERGLRRGMAIARRHEWERAKTVDWTAAEAQMEREIEEAKR